MRYVLFLARNFRSPKDPPCFFVPICTNVVLCMLRFITMSEPESILMTIQRRVNIACVFCSSWDLQHKSASLVKAGVEVSHRCSFSTLWLLRTGATLHINFQPARCELSLQQCYTMAYTVFCHIAPLHCFYCWVPSTSNSILCGQKFTSHLCQIKSKPLTSHKGVHPFSTIEQKFIVLDWFPQGNANRFSSPLPSLYWGD